MREAFEAIEVQPQDVGPLVIKIVRTLRKADRREYFKRKGKGRKRG